MMKLCAEPLRIHIQATIAHVEAKIMDGTLKANDPKVMTTLAALRDMLVKTDALCCDDDQNCP
jgi:hypothetical protein